TLSPSRLSFLFTPRLPPGSTLFPYTTLFRSRRSPAARPPRRSQHDAPGARGAAGLSWRAALAGLRCRGRAGRRDVLPGNRRHLLAGNGRGLRPLLGRALLHPRLARAARHEPPAARAQTQGHPQPGADRSGYRVRAGHAARGPFRARRGPPRAGPRAAPAAPPYPATAGLLPAGRALAHLPDVGG